MDHRRFALVKATRRASGDFILTDKDGDPVQESYPYPTESAALEAAAQLWPEASVWQGKRVADGWRIVTSGA